MRRRLAGVVLAAALVVPVSTATPAQANHGQCHTCGVPGDSFPPGVSAALVRLRAVSPTAAAQVEARIRAAFARIPDNCGRVCTGNS